MKTPFPLMGVSLCFWGWQTGLWPVGLGMALVLELSFFVKTRIDLGPADYSRISDLCTLILAAMFFYLLLSQQSARSLLLVFQWLPMALFPLALAQAYGSAEKIPIYALLMLARRRRRKTGETAGIAMNLSHVYFGLCLLSAGASNLRTPWFYPALLLLSAWALWSSRSRRFSPLLWLALLIWAGGIGYLGHVGLHRLQGYLENAATEWFTAFRRSDPDPYRATTSIGDVGTLKQSDRILFRVAMEGRNRLLLREAAYNVYKFSEWFALDSRFGTLSATGDGATWPLGTPAGEGKRITVLSPLREGKGMLKLPGGVLAIGRLPVTRMLRNQFGSVRVEGGPGFVEYDVNFDPETPADSPPARADLVVPDAERPAIRQVADKLGLASKPPHEVVRAMKAFFEDHFLYSLVLKAGDGKMTPLRDFLITTRRGHCEYFATATVLLLRELGLPARYATGFSVHEFSGWEKRFVVRARHGHAWVLVWMDGAWRDLDTTPPSWIAQENKAASLMEPVSDLWAWCTLQFSRLRWQQGGGRISGTIPWLLIPLALLLLWRFRGIRGRKTHAPQPAKSPAVAVRKGLDSEFYEIEKMLAGKGFPRHSWETASHWIERISRDPSLGLPVERLSSVLTLHYRYRFDPEGITEDERSTLRTEARSCQSAQRNGNPVA
ncbi:MAG: transglutaminase domain-containing protein [Thermodesulfobacteriota bacterium]